MNPHTKEFGVDIGCPRIKFDFKPKKDNWEKKRFLPCGRCYSCQCNRANEWATRAVAEARKWKQGCFVTLTYDENNIKEGRILSKADTQGFWKRLRAAEQGAETYEYKGKAKNGIRYIICGEYGPKTRRPHYHALIFNYCPDDLKQYKKNKNGDWTYTSKKLEKIWGKGFVVVGKITQESAAYVARYTRKKSGLCEQKKKIAEFILSSKDGGIGYYYWQDKKDEIKRNMGIFIKNKDGKVLLKGIPRYMEKLWMREGINQRRILRFIKYIKFEENQTTLKNQIKDRVSEFFINIKEKNIIYKKLLRRDNCE